MSDAKILLYFTEGSFPSTKEITDAADNYKDYMVNFRYSKDVPFFTDQLEAADAIAGVVPRAYGERMDAEGQPVYAWAERPHSEPETYPVAPVANEPTLDSVSTLPPPSAPPAES